MFNIMALELVKSVFPVILIGNTFIVVKLHDNKSLTSTDDRCIIQLESHNLLMLRSMRYIVSVFVYYVHVHMR